MESYLYGKRGAVKNRSPTAGMKVRGKSFEKKSVYINSFPVLGINLSIWEFVQIGHGNSA